MMKLIDKQLLDKVSVQAKESERLRMNYNFHQSLEDKCHRFLNAVEPGTEVSFAGITEIRNQGYTEIRSDGTPDPDSFGIVETIDMYPGGPILNIEKGQWHSLKRLSQVAAYLSASRGRLFLMKRTES